MRELLFRGKDESGKWAYGRLAYDVMSLGAPDAIVDKDGITVIDPDTVGQYTGVCDKHGNKIFEGDILMINDDEGEVGVVSWDDDCAAYIVDEGSVVLDLGEFWARVISVVGNSWDNPELLQTEGE